MRPRTRNEEPIVYQLWGSYRYIYPHESAARESLIDCVFRFPYSLLALFRFGPASVRVRQSAPSRLFPTKFCCYYCDSVFLSFLSSDLLALSLSPLFALLVKPPPSSSSSPLFCLLPPFPPPPPLSLSLQSDSSRGARVSVSACCVFGSLLSVGFALKAAFLLAAAIIATAVRIHLNRSKSHSSLLLSFGCYNLPFTLG